MPQTMPKTMPKTIKITREGSMVTIALDRPEAFNALNFELADDLAQAALELARDDSVAAVVITGAGKAFCAGGDLRWVGDHPAGPAAAFHQLAGRLHQAVIELARMDKPVIAAVNGVAAGAGFTLALACDFRVMARSAKFVQAYTSAGLSIDGGGTFTLPRLVGTARALEIAAFDRPITADQANAWGLVTRLAADGDVLAQAQAMAHELTARSVHSFAASKRLIRESLHTTLETQLERERDALVACGSHPHGREGVAAFREKRKPDFK